LSILAMFMSFILACWLMYEPSLERLGMGTVFAFFSYLMVNIKERKQNERPEGPGA
jgi:Ca2+/Na+ antiporter